MTAEITLVVFCQNELLAEMHSVDVVTHCVRK